MHAERGPGRGTASTNLPAGLASLCSDFPIHMHSEPPALSWNIPHKFKSEVPAAVSPTGQGRPGRPGPGRQQGPLPRVLGALQSVGPSGEPPGSLGICKVGLKLKPQQDRALDLMGVGVAAWFPPGRSRGGCGGNPDAHLARLCVLDGSEHEDPAPRGSAPFLKMSTMVTSTPTTHIQDFKALEMLPLGWRLEKLHPTTGPSPVGRPV